MAFAARQGFAVHYILAALILVMSAIAPAAAQVVPARSEGPAWQTQVRQDALNGDDRRTRFVIGLDREAKYSFLTLPNRVVITPSAFRKYAANEKLLKHGKQIVSRSNDGKCKPIVPHHAMDGDTDASASSDADADGDADQRSHKHGKSRAAMRTAKRRKQE